MKKRIVIAVISDLVTDQRVHKVSLSLTRAGYDVLLIGAKRKKSKALGERPYKAKRIRMLFQKGPLFYAEWNIRLFFKLLFTKATAITANDLDTLPACYRAAWFKRKTLIYDTHEYFTEMQELQGRARVKRFWLRIEKKLFPKLQHIYTVNGSIADIYRQLYNKELTVVRNLPLRPPPVSIPSTWPDRKILLCQGAGLHHHRGLEELVLSLNYLPDDFSVILAGSGLAVEELKQLCADQRLEDRVTFTGLLPMEQLAAVTQTAFIGFSLDKPTSPNQLYSLPNKLFDYLAAGKPVIASDLPEVKKIVEGYNVGLIVPEITPPAIAGAVMALSKNEAQYKQLAQNAVNAVRELCWENEEPRLLHLYKSALGV